MSGHDLDDGGEGGGGGVGPRGERENPGVHVFYRFTQLRREREFFIVTDACFVVLQWKYQWTLMMNSRSCYSNAIQRMLISYKMIENV